MKSKVLTYNIILQPEPEGGFTVLVPALPGCITYGKTFEEAQKMAKEAIDLYLECLDDKGEDIPLDNPAVFLQSIKTDFQPKKSKLYA